MEPGRNPHRTPDLFAYTTDGYLVAEDIDCQYGYVAMQRCPETGAPLRVVAQINRAYQGLNELVAVSAGTGKIFSFIFDISNEVYQSWLQQSLGELYVRPFDGPPRAANPRRRYRPGRAD